MRAEPLVGVMNPAIIRMVVDLPAPLGPRKPSTSPGSTEKLRSSTASMPSKFFTRFCVWIMASSDQGAREWFSAGAAILRKEGGDCARRANPDYMPVMRAGYS